MATEIIRFGKKVFTTTDGTVTPATDKKVNRSNLAVEKRKAKENDDATNALKLATYLKGRASDESVWAYIGKNPVVVMQKTSVSDPADNDNVEEFEVVVRERAVAVLPVWFDSIAKEYRTMRSTIASFFNIASFVASENERDRGRATRSNCYETMYKMAKLMGLTFSKSAFRAFETSVNRLKMDEFGHGSVKMFDLDKTIMAALRLSDASIADHDKKLTKKYC